MENLRVYRKKLYIKSKLYIPDNNELNMYMLWQYHHSPEQRYPNHKAMFQNMQNKYFLPDKQKIVKNMLLTVACTARQKYIIFKNKGF